MSRLGLDAGQLGRLLRSRSTMGLGIGERNQADRSERKARPIAAGPADPDRRRDGSPASMLRRRSVPQRDRLLAAVPEVERPLVASGERPPRDDLGELLADIGYRIAQHGQAAEPRIQLLADALRATRPVAAALLPSPAEPDIVSRAFLHLACAAPRQPRPQRDTLAAALARREKAFPNQTSAPDRMLRYRSARNHRPHRIESTDRKRPTKCPVRSRTAPCWSHPTACEAAGAARKLQRADRLAGKRADMSDCGRPAHYEIRIEGTLDSRWTAWFEGLQVKNESSETIISGLLTDQAALHGVLVKVRDLGLCLISLHRLDSE
jgi:hypothetical protein